MRKDEMTHPSPPVVDDGRFKLGDLVRKKGGSSWRGKIVGEYSTGLTQRGYAVESLFEPGSVQIYPESALVPYAAPSMVTDNEVERVARGLQHREAEIFGYVGRPDLYDQLWLNNKRRFLGEARAALVASDRDVLVAENARLREALTYAKEYLCGECNVGALAEIQAIERIDAALNWLTKPS